MDPIIATALVGLGTVFVTKTAEVLIARLGHGGSLVTMHEATQLAEMASIRKENEMLKERIEEMEIELREIEARGQGSGPTKAGA